MITTEPTERPTADVVIVGDGDALDVALGALVEKCGHRAVIAGLGDLASCRARVVLVRDEVAMGRAARELRGRAVTFVGLVVPTSPVKSIGGRRVHWLRGRDVVGDLGRILHDAVRLPRTVVGCVRLSHRELCVIACYVSGATSKQTAAEFGISEHTVKTHFARVKAKYCAVGRPVTNKAQVFRELMIDGWIPAEGDHWAA